MLSRYKLVLESQIEELFGKGRLDDISKFHKNKAKEDRKRAGSLLDKSNSNFRGNYMKGFVQGKNVDKLDKSSQAHTDASRRAEWLKGRVRKGSKDKQYFKG